MKYDLVIFDLDGTILDTLEDLSYAANTALGEFRFPARSSGDIRQFIGNGVSHLIRMAVPRKESDETCADVLKRFKTLYLENVNRRTVPYPGIPALLESLRTAGIKTAVNTNKVDRAARLLCEAHFPGCFDIVLGEVADIPKKPAPDGTRQILDRLAVSAGRALYVGDGETDLMTARNAGIDCVWVSWGFRSREELGGLDIPHSAESVSDLKDFILSED